MPRFHDIAKSFGDLVRTVRSSDESSEMTADEVRDAGNRRSKRQTSNIGDESPLPYEIRSSRLKNMLCLYFGSHGINSFKNDNYRVRSAI